MKSRIALILAAGIGRRMNADLPKQFMEINHKPIIIHTIEKFIQAYSDIEFIVVFPKDFLESGKKIIENKRFPNKFIYVIGGETRFHSVQNGLNVVQDKDSVIFIHDAARCFVSLHLIRKCYQETLIHQNAIPAITSNNSIRVGTFENNKIVSRNQVFIIQTPQTFHYQEIQKAYQLPFQEEFTDDASVLEAAGGKIFLIEGEAENIKITSPLDLKIANLLV